MFIFNDAVHIFITLLLLIPSTLAAIDCRSACHACHAKEQPKEMLEIYCAMCQECKERRKERIKAKVHLAQLRTTTERISVAPANIVPLQFNLYADQPPGDSLEGAEITGLNVIQDIPPGCPTPPPCSDDEEPKVPLPVHLVKTTIPTTTTPRPTCPPIKPCKKKKLTTPIPCAPCCPVPPCSLPCLPYPFPYPPPPGFSGPPFSPGPWPSSTSTVLTTKSPTQPSEVIRTKTEADYMYMYVGVPKNMLRKKR